MDFHLYAGIGAELVRFTVTPDGARLSWREAVRLAESVQYAVPHADGRHLYVAVSNGASGNGPGGDRHSLASLRIDAATGALAPAGPVIDLPSRPIHIATDGPSGYLLAAFNRPAAVRVYAIRADGTLGESVAQPHAGDVGIFPHQVRAAPGNRVVTVIARGHDETPEAAEEPGRLTVFGFSAGVLRDPFVVAPNGGFGFGPRDLAFHPRRPWLYMSLERQNELAMFDWREGRPELRWRKNTLADLGMVRGRQIVGPVFLHPDGGTAYVANRASATVRERGREIFAGGENAIAVFSLDRDTGEPVLIQNAETHGIHPRSFLIDPAGRLLIAAHTMGLTVRTPAGPRDVPVSIAVFRIGGDGRLEHAGNFPAGGGGGRPWWIGAVPAPAR